METQHVKPSAVVLISCPDQKGIDAAITGFISAHHGNIIHLDQHVDFEQNVFFMRIEWELEGFRIAQDNIAEEIAKLAAPFRIDWQLFFSNRKPRMAVFVSRLSHCLHDILARVQSAEWAVDIPCVISNHADLGALVSRFDIPYYHLPIEPGAKDAQEARTLELLQTHEVDFIVLARYMQIISPRLLEPFTHRIINIHHSFLPAFPGARPYHSAYARGVKIIGATSHYVTEELDAGPIIEQDIIRVSHKDSIADLVRKGRDLEKIVLSRAIWHHLQHKVLIYNNKTVIFD
ncbi:MAG: formyltetrahydrofolate deformylase [Spartobacteria bacterium]|nr:formyltetrahydrofolate deformylase [Spartobacteria bacterium]